MPERVSSILDTYATLLPSKFGHICSLSNSRVTCLVLLLPILALVTYFRFWDDKRHTKSSEIIHVLSSIITPTCSAWPRDYAATLNSTISNRSKTITIKLSTLLQGVCAGTIELRDSRDLASLLNNGLRIYGWEVHLSRDVLLLPSLLRSMTAYTKKVPPPQLSDYPWFFPLLCLPQTPGATPANRRTVQQLLELVKSPSLDLHHVILAPRDYDSVAYLDFIPYTSIETAIRNVQHNLQPGTSVPLVFTLISPKVPFLSDQFYFCCLPFLPRNHAANYLPRRTLTTVLTPLHRIIELLMTGPSVTSVKAMKDTTAEHIETLRVLEQELTMNRTLRSAIIEKWGLSGWREHRFMVTWEQGLMLSGCLSRWMIIIQK